MSHKPEVTLNSYVSRKEFLLNECSNKKTLHLGCSAGKHIQARIDRGSLLHESINNISSELHGLDLEEESLDVMRKDYGFSNLYQGNAEKLEEVDFGTTFDIVLAGDLLEHLTCPGAMLDGVKALLNDQGKIISNALTVLSRNKLSRTF